ncbi:armadillo-type protein [Infundibulicybe gibba]|nr:armadillo-type protein [Infundibulicybe gibba]
MSAEIIAAISGGALLLPAPALGTRDLAQLRTLISIVFKWGLEPLFHNDYARLAEFILEFETILLPNGLGGRMSQTLITATILNRHVSDLLKPCITVAWLPNSSAPTSARPMREIQPFILRILATLPPAQAISSPLPPFVRKRCSAFLSRELLRPEGVHGLCAVVFGEGESAAEDAPIEKLEHVARVLTTAPALIKPEEYFPRIMPRIVDLLSEGQPHPYRRAAAFTISKMIEIGNPLAIDTILRFLHSPFLQPTLKTDKPIGQDSLSPTSLGGPASITPSDALSKLLVLMTNTDPSPNFISAMLSPIVVALYSLLHHMYTVKTADPTLKESLRGILVTWGRIVGAPEGLEILWSMMNSSKESPTAWKIDIGGEISRLEKSDRPPPLAMLTPEDLRKDDEIDLDSNMLDLYPDPTRFVQFLKAIDRPEISSDIFVRLLEGYQKQKSSQDNDPMQCVRCCRVSEGTSSSNILCKPMHMLLFIKHVLESSPTSIRLQRRRLKELHFKPDVKNVEEEDEGDSDDDTPGADIVTRDDEMIETAINLLLSILEVNEDLSARTTPVLNDIFSLLEPLTRDGAVSIKPLAREARMVMTARVASSSSARLKRPRNTEEDSSQELYQKALKLLQDPILPVRGHGLLLLRQLVSSKGADPALVPAVMAIFLQSIHDEDSLAAMVDTFGRDVLHGLVKEYADGLDGLAGATTMTQHDVDGKVKVGEALGTVIRKCGSALGVYVDILVPTLFKIVGSRHVPTTLRTSSLSLLGECVRTHPIALLPYIPDLTEAMIDLLQLESVWGPAPKMDTQPTSANPKFPRSDARHYISLPC